MDLAYPLTDTVNVNGKEYPLNASFDNVLRLIDMLNDDGLNDVEQIVIGLKMLIGTSLPEYPFDEKEEIFYRIYQELLGIDMEEVVPVDIAGNPMPSKKEERTYDLKKDAEYIYASFMSDYGIDLFEQQGKLHWKKFQALLGGLTEGSKFVRVIQIRAMELPTGKGTEKQRKQIQELKEYYKLE